MTFKMFAKGLLLLLCAPILMPVLVLAIIPTFIVKMVQLLINHSNTPADVAQPEEASRLVPESSNLAHVVGWH